MESAKAEVLTILHFNDCYNIEERAQEPVGGVARFHTAVHSFDKVKPLVFFSGDLYSPSICKIPCYSKVITRKFNYSEQFACRTAASQADKHVRSALRSLWESRLRNFTTPISN